MDPAKYEVELIEKTRRMSRMAAFNLECIAHLRGRERELLPLVTALREIASILEQPIVSADPPCVLVVTHSQACKTVEAVEFMADRSRTPDEALEWNTIREALQGEPDEVDDRPEGSHEFEKERYGQ